MSMSKPAASKPVVSRLLQALLLAVVWGSCSCSAFLPQHRPLPHSSSSSSSSLLVRPRGGYTGPYPPPPGVAFAAGPGSSSSTYKPLVYAYYRSRSKIIEWYLQELGVAYDTVPIDMGEKEHKAEAFLKNVNIFGKLPVMTMADGTPIHESGAQLLYLADVFDPHCKTPEARGMASQWTHFANASLGPAIFMKEQREAGVMDKLFAVLDQLLAERPYLEGERFGVSDVAVGAYLSYIPVFFPDISLKAYPHLSAYVAKLTARPAFAKTVGAPPPSA